MVPLVPIIPIRLFLVTDAAWIEAPVITSKTGALIDMTDSETLARQFLRLEQAGDLRKSIGQAAKEQAEKLTFEHFVEILSRILSEKL